MDKFFKTYNLTSLNHEEKQHLNRPVTSIDIESVIKTLPTKKVQDKMISLVISTKH